MRELEFPVGRALNLLFRPTSETDEEKQLWTSALGEYAAQQTHSLKTKSLPSRINNSLYSKCAINKVDFTGNILLGKANLVPKQANQPYNPAVIAYISQGLVHNHNGIFGETFSDFLAESIAFIEGKRMCLIRNRRTGRSYSPSRASDSSLLSRRRAQP